MKPITFNFRGVIWGSNECLAEHFWVPGVILELSVLELSWNCPGAVLELCWNFPGTVLKLYWRCHVIVILLIIIIVILIFLGSHKLSWSCPGTVLDLSWSCPGILLELFFWDTSGTLLEHFWEAFIFLVPSIISLSPAGWSYRYIQ